MSEAKTAAIYVRTSSEHQGEKASPEEQERDCRALAEEQGLVVVKVYRDITKYRVRGKLVEPTGTRQDRPGLLEMLRDAEAGHFRFVLAWKEDRLYRGLRAMLMVLDAREKFKFEILLARETFDPKMAPIKAWVAQMELDSMKERMTMGVKARLRAGKANTGQDRYGYRRNGEVIELVEEEAEWVRKIFAWYIEGVPMLEMRDRLIAGGAPQKGSSIPRKIEWAMSSIYGILKGAEVYATGIKIQTRKGEAFEIPVPRIIDQATYRRFLEVREGNKSYPAHNLKRDYLVRGLIYCPCGNRWSARTNKRFRRNAEGKRIKRKTFDGAYFCRQRHKELVHPDCPRTIGSKKADDYVWARVVEVLNDPGILLSGALDYVAKLQQEAAGVNAERERLQAALDALMLERQRVITFARKGQITELDLEYQLATLELQETHCRRELAAQRGIQELLGLDDWEQVVVRFLDGVRERLASLDRAADTEEERQALFEARRKIVLDLVKEVRIGRDRRLDVVFFLDPLSLAEEARAMLAQNEMAGTYTGMLDLDRLRILVTL